MLSNVVEEFYPTLKTRLLTPNACWLLKIRCVVRRIFARCEYGYDLAYDPGVVSA